MPRLHNVSILALGLNHTTAPLDMRARFALPAGTLAPALQAISKRVRRSAESEQRRDAVVQAEAIVEHGVHGFVQWLDRRGNVPLIQALQRQADEWRCAEIARARRALARGEAVDDVLLALSRGVARKMLHGPLAELHATDGAGCEALGRTLERLFLARGSAH